MSAVALASPIEAPVADTLASLILRQIAQHDGARPRAPQSAPMRPGRARAWRAVAAGLWRATRDAAALEGAGDTLPWTARAPGHDAAEVARAPLAIPMRGRGPRSLPPRLQGFHGPMCGGTKAGLVPCAC